VAQGASVFATVDTWVVRAARDAGEVMSDDDKLSLSVKPRPPAEAPAVLHCCSAAVLCRCNAASLQCCGRGGGAWGDAGAGGQVVRLFRIFKIVLLFSRLQSLQAPRAPPVGSIFQGAS